MMKSIFYMTSYYIPSAKSYLWTVDVMLYPMTGRGRCLDIPTGTTDQPTSSQRVFFGGHIWGWEDLTNQHQTPGKEGGFHPKINFNYQLCGQGGFRTSQIPGTNPTNPRMQLWPSLPTSSWKNIEPKNLTVGRLSTTTESQSSVLNYQ